MSNTWCKAFGVSCVLSSFLTGACEPSPPGSHERPITVERLTGATLVEIGRDKSIVWHFGVERFLLEIRGGPRDALVRQLLGRAADARQIQGQWQFDEKKNQLVLHDLVADNLRNPHQVVLPMLPAGLFRADLGDRQYNIDELDICGRWESVGEGPRVSWTFEGRPSNSLAIQCEEGTLPAALTTKLFGHPAEVSRIGGEWESKRSRRLVLTKLRAGTHRQTEPIETTIKPVDVLTVELLGSQYRRVKWLRPSAFNPDTIRSNK